MIILQRRKKLFQPFFLIAMLVCPRPAAEFFAIVGINSQTARVFFGLLFEFVYDLCDSSKGNQIPKFFLYRQKPDLIPFFLGNKDTVEVFMLKTGVKKMSIIDKMNDTPMYKSLSKRERLQIQRERAK
ncbi:MAG: hypothetical protein DRP51_09385, partial [Candidatus Zixiibacteriota bacterium]